MEVIRFYWKYIKPYFLRFLAVMLITIPIGLLDGAIPGAIKPFFDALTKGKDSRFHIEWIPLFIIGLSVVQSVLGYYSRYLEGWVGQRLITEVRMDAYRKLLNQDTQWLQNNDSGYALSRIYNDPVNIQGFLIISIRTILFRLASIVSITIAMFTMNWKLALIAMGAVGLLIIPIREVNKKIGNQNNTEKNNNNNVMSMVNAAFMGFKVILSYNLQQELTKRFKAWHDNVFNQVMRVTKAQAWLSLSIYVITAVAIAVIMFYGTHLIMTGEMTSGAMVAFIASLLMLYRPMRSFGDTIISAQRQLIGMTLFKQMIEDKSIEQPQTSHLKKMGPLQHKIELKFLYFRYYKRQDNPAVNKIDLIIPKGKMVALVGRSGSGKTTVAELIMGIYPVHLKWSDILYDGISFRELDMASVREQISYVSQDTFLFEGTLRSNLHFGRLDATEAEILQAVRQANLMEFVESLPDGLDTKIGERGVMLSGGQRQRLAIARAFLKNAPILILDEATSSLDNESEAVVQNALEELMVNRTTLVIAHRLSTIQKADKIVVMDEGKIIEEGTHAELLAKEGLYYQLFHAQKFAPIIQSGSELEAAAALEDKTEVGV